MKGLLSMQEFSAGMLKEAGELIKRFADSDWAYWIGLDDVNEECPFGVYYSRNSGDMFIMFGDWFKIGEPHILSHKTKNLVKYERTGYSGIEFEMIYDVYNSDNSYEILSALYEARDEYKADWVQDLPLEDACADWDIFDKMCDDLRELYDFDELVDDLHRGKYSGDIADYTL